MLIRPPYLQEHRPDPEAGRVSNCSSPLADSKYLDLDMSFDRNEERSVSSTCMNLAGPKSKCRAFKSDFLHGFHFSFTFAVLLLCLASSIHVSAGGKSISFLKINVMFKY